MNIQPPILWIKILNSSHNGIVVVDEYGEIIVYNNAARSIFKENNSQMVGKKIYDVHPEVWPNFQEILQTGQPQIGIKLNLGGTTIIANRRPVIVDTQIVGVISIFQDISEYERIISKLQSYQILHNELEAIIETSDDGLYVTDGQANTLRVNRSYERITGLSRSDLIGRNMHDLVAAKIFDHSVTLEVLKQRASVSILQNVKGDKQVLVTGNPIKDERGKIVYVVTNVRDVTELNELREQLENTRRISSRYYQSLLEQEGIEHVLQEMVIKSQAMMKVVKTAIKVAGFNNSVLLQGESGVGKSMLARLIHQISPRKDKPFVKINCGAIPDSLLESELFGYEKGAFTGAVDSGKAGLFETGDTGTVFLDEISEIRQDLQVKLLEIIEDQTFHRVGGIRPVSVDVRIIAATNRDLLKMVKEERFREDLYYRLNVVPIVIPPLRERSEDILPLAMKFLENFNSSRKKKMRLNQKVIDRLKRYSYPGNVRELFNVLERMVIMCENESIGPDDMPEEFRDSDLSMQNIFFKGLGLKESVQQLEMQLIQNAIEESSSLAEAAARLDIHPSTLWRKITRYRMMQSC